MGLSSSGFTKQVELTLAKTPQAIEPPAGIGADNPQTASVAVKALKSNKGPLFIGFSKAELEPEGAGFELVAGETLTMNVNGLGKAWFSGANAKDKLCLLGVGP